MKEFFWWQKRSQPHVEPISATATKLHEAKAKRDSDKKDAAQKKQQSDEEAQAKLRAQIQHAKEVNQRLATLWNQYDQTPCSESIGILYSNIAAFDVKKDDEYPNYLERRRIEDVDHQQWVGERVSWVWNDYMKRHRIHEDEHGAWIPFRLHPFDIKHFFERKHYKLKLNNDVVHSEDSERSITLRYFADNHIEVAGKDNVSFSMNGHSPEQMREWLDNQLGRAMVYPKKRLVKSGY